MIRTTLFLCLLMAMSAAGPAYAQTAADLNEGLKVAEGTTPGDHTLTWWGRPGRTYFIQQSFDLMEWNWVPTVESGAGSVSGINFTCADERQFWRLVHTDAPTGGNALTADFDGDGISNADEVSAAYGTNPFLQDSDWDGYSDQEEILAGTDPNSGSSNPGTQQQGAGLLNPDSSYRNGLRLAYAFQGMSVHYDGTTSNAWAAHTTANGPTFFYPATAQAPDDVTQEVSALYESASFMALDQNLFQTSNALWLTPSQWEVAYGAQITTKYTFRHRIQLQALPSPAAPGDASRTLVAFYYEGGNSDEFLKAVGTITLSQLNVSCSEGIRDHCQIVGNKVVIEPKLDPNPKDLDPDPANTYTTQSISLSLMDVDIEPDTGMAGVVGDVVKSARVGSRIRHFVTPKKSTELPQEYVEFTALGVSETRFDDLFEWQGGEPGSAPNKRKVKRDATGMTKLQIKTKRDQLVVDEMHVWVVWCDAPTVTQGAASFEKLTKPNNITGPDGQPIQMPPLTIGKRWEIKTDYWKFKFAIKPFDICNPAYEEKPDLKGPRKADVPGVGKLHTTAVSNGDGDHAAKKWDVSRQMKITIRNPSGIPKASLMEAGTAWYDKQPVADDTPVEFPDDRNPAEGNDDPASSDEDDNPYEICASANLEHQVGELSSLDDPKLPVLNDWGAAGIHYGIEANFREFCRLEINDGSRTSGTFWFCISDYFLWHHYLSTDYDGTSNEWQNAGSSSGLGHAIP